MKILSPDEVQRVLASQRLELINDLREFTMTRILRHYKNGRAGPFLWESTDGDLSADQMKRAYFTKTACPSEWQVVFEDLKDEGWKVEFETVKRSSGRWFLPKNHTDTYVVFEKNAAGLSKTMTQPNSTLTPEQQQVDADCVNNHRIPPRMSKVIGEWIINIQDAMPDEIRNSRTWKISLPLAAETGREREGQMIAIILDWMWGTVLPILQTHADKNGFGADWRTMCEHRTNDAAHTAAHAAVHAATRAARAAYAVDMTKSPKDFEAARAAIAATRAAHAASHASKAAQSTFVAIIAIAAAHAADAACATALAAGDDSWSILNPPALLQKLVNNTQNKMNNINVSPDSSCRQEQDPDIILIGNEEISFNVRRSEVDIDENGMVKPKEGEYFVIPNTSSPLGSESRTKKTKEPLDWLEKGDLIRVETSPGEFRQYVVKINAGGRVLLSETGEETLYVVPLCFIETMLGSVFTKVYKEHPVD